MFICAKLTHADETAKLGGAKSRVFCAPGWNDSLPCSQGRVGGGPLLARGSKAPPPTLPLRPKEVPLRGKQGEGQKADPKRGRNAVRHHAAGLLLPLQAWGGASPAATQTSARDFSSSA